MIKILCVCLGNICRSPAAEGILRQRLTSSGLQEGEDYQLDSCGTGDWHIGHSPDQRSQLICSNNAVDISHLRARQLTKLDGEEVDLILCMDQSNDSEIKKIIDADNYPKIQFFDLDQEVSDPYYGGDEGFSIMYQQLNLAAEHWVNQVKLSDQD